MKRTGPIITLAAGIVVAGVLMVLNLNTTGAAENTAGDGATTTVPATTAAASTPPTSPTPAKAAGPITYAGNVDGGAATLAIAIKDGQAIAYVCDGRKAEAWLKGTAEGGQLTLTGAHEATVTGSYGNGKVAGTVRVAGKSWTFSLASVKPPSGLYRAAANVNGATVVGGWIVLADGTQVGVVTVDGAAQPASALDPGTGRTDVNGTAVSATPVDGTTL